MNKAKRYVKNSHGTDESYGFLKNTEVDFQEMRFERLGDIWWNQKDPGQGFQKQGLTDLALH